MTVTLTVRPPRAPDKAPPPSPSIDWRKREQDRFASGHYEKPVWHGDYWTTYSVATDHFVHVSREDPQLLAYTQNADKGARDIKTKIKPGAYLQKFYRRHLAPATIATYAAQHRAAFDPATTLTIATDPEDCKRAYQAIGTCMQFARDSHPGVAHPALSYGSADEDYVTVAFITHNDRITARALLNRKSKRYCSVYGDHAVIKYRLRKLGYIDDTSALFGLKIRAIPNGANRTPSGRQQWCAPGIDGHHYGKLESEPCAATGETIHHIRLVPGNEYERLPASEKIYLTYNGVSS